MNVVMKKLMLILLAALLGVISNGAMADSYYDFTATFTGDITSVFKATLFNGGNDPSMPFTSLSNLSSIPLPPGLTFSEITPIGSVYGHGNQSGAPNHAYTDFTFSFLEAPIYYRLTAQNILGATAGGTGTLYVYASLSDAQSQLNAFGGGNLDSASFIQSVGDVAPEMNASFIPQVALMLACLFFLLGRKKENTEPLLSA